MPSTRHLLRLLHCASLCLAVLALTAAPARPTPLDDGVQYLASAQQADGGWNSTRVRRSQAISEALVALAGLDALPAARTAAADLLEAGAATDNDDRARRILALAAEGRPVASLVTQLLADVGSDGGWGLTSSFAADPLDTALALAVLSPPAASDDVLRSALVSLIEAQGADGGWPCIDSGDAESEIFCTSQALLALVSHREVYFLTPEIDAAADFLRGRRNLDGSFGPAGPDQVIETALASLALAAVPAFGNEVGTVISFLVDRQQADGSWEGDPYPTALALRAIQALATVPYCGDGAINQPGEACDGGVPAGVTCEALALGPGTIACSPQCTLDTSGCSAAPICGDDVRNQAFEVCDGTDLAAETCETQGFATGTLACATDCLSFDVSGCNTAPACGDGIVNQPGEACDLDDFSGTTCESLGLGGGQLSCTSDCNFDTTQCDSSTFVIDNKGREFVVGFMPNPLGSATASVQLTSDVPTTVTIQYPVSSPSFSTTVALTPGQVSVVNLPAGSHSAWTAGRVMNNAVRVFGPDQFVTYVVNRAQFTSDAGMALPVDALGTSYIVTTYRGSAIVSQDRSQFLVLAAFDDTTITITPKTTVRIPPPGTNAPANAPFQITLDRGQGFRAEALLSGTDLTGTLIESDKPIAMLNGNICTNVPSSTAYCDHIFEVAHPLRSWGTSALVRNLPNRNGGSIYRVVASVDGTQVSRDGALQATLNKGQFLETGPLTGSHLFEATQPIFVTQFMTGSTSAGASLGDPAMANMIPPDQYLKSYTFSTVGGSQFVQHFLTVIAPDSSIGSITLDGTPIAVAQFTPIGSTGYSSALVTIAQGSHTTVSPEPHGITVEGINQDDSYVYPGGAQIEFINQFCGDGAANRDSEECDGTDFHGSTCTAFGFASGLLQCTDDCRVDTSQCSGFSVEDKDDDGFPVSDDCNDLDPEVNPGMPEIPGNGVDDDCNPATPDDIPQGIVACELLADRVLYAATDLVTLEAAVTNAHESLSLTGLSSSLRVSNGGGTSIHDEARPLAALPPGARAQESFVFAADGNPPADYTAELTISAGGRSLAVCSASFAIESSAAIGAGLAGTLTLDPELVDAGDPTDAAYTVENRGNAPLVDLAIRVVLLDPETGAVMDELLDAATLEPGASFSATQPFSTIGLSTNKSYLAVLLAKPSETEVEQTLDSAPLTVVNAPPDCSDAVVDPVEIRTPNHRLVDVTVGGVTDPDGDPVTVTVSEVFQDERTDELGSGDTCPDATGIGTSRARLRAERSGRQDGRVYHVFFAADDGRGGRCEGEVQVCVEHDRGHGGGCVDQGALHDATLCR